MFNIVYLQIGTVSLPVILSMIAMNLFAQSSDLTFTQKLVGESLVGGVFIGMLALIIRYWFHQEKRNEALRQEREAEHKATVDRLLKERNEMRDKYEALLLKKNKKE
jgi:uncharacterized membrane protein